MNTETIALLFLCAGLGLFFIFPAWLLGVVRIFLSVLDDKAPSKLSPSLKFFIAWLFSFVVGAIFPLSMLIGILEMLRQWTRYKARKHMTKEQAEITGNISIWAEACKEDRLKLIYAYVISPLLIFAVIGTELFGELRNWHKLNATRYSVAFSMANKLALRLSLMSYIPLILPPIIVRFVFIRRELNRGLETYAYMVLSLFLSLVLYFFITGVMPSGFGLLGTLSVYCVLSYRSSGYSKAFGSMWYVYLRYVLTLLTIASVFYLPSLTETRRGKNVSVYFPIWEAIVLCYVLYATRRRDNDKTEAPHPVPPPTFNSSSAPPDKPAELTATALALIGRPTLHENEYLTPAMTQSRHEAERPFVKILSATYRTDTERKAMSQHFMLWKEFAVFVALSQVLKSDKALLAQTQSKLKECLNEGLPPDVLRKRVERMRAMSGTFTAEYKISGSLEQSFLRTFRETLPDELPELPDSESVGGYLVGIYRFIYGRLKREYQGLRERERV